MRRRPRSHRGANRRKKDVDVVEIVAVIDRVIASVHLNGNDTLIVIATGGVFAGQRVL